MAFFDEETVLQKLKQGDRTAFSFLFTTFYTDLVIFALGYTRNRETAEEIVQEVFVRLWENHRYLTVNSSLKSFLLRSVQNKCIDWLRHLEIRKRHRNIVLESPVLLENDTDKFVLYSELHTALEQALEQIPEEASGPFRLNRFEGLTYKEIAKKLGVSVRTVEVRISKTLFHLREKLKDHLMLALLFLCLEML